jgi:hypothetical protein
MIYTYPPDFVMVFKKYRKQSSWDRDAILNRALLVYVNEKVTAPAVVRTATGDERGSKTELRNINREDIPGGVKGGELDVEAKEMVSDLLNVKSEVGERAMETQNKAAGFDAAKIKTIVKAPIVLVAIAIGVLGWFLFAGRRG